MARLKVNSITDRNNSGQPTLTFGATLPSGSRLNVQGNVNVSGVSTVGFLTTSNITAGIVTATTFVGNGAQLQGLQTTTPSKSIALKIILDPLPFRS